MITSFVGIRKTKTRTIKKKTLNESYGFTHTVLFDDAMCAFKDVTKRKHVLQTHTVGTFREGSVWVGKISAMSEKFKMKKPSSVGRFLAVVHPIASIYVRTERNASSAIIVTWVLIVLLALPVLARHGEVSYTYSSIEHTSCIFLDRDPNTRPDGYNKPAYQVRTARW